MSAPALIALVLVGASCPLPAGGASPAPDFRRTIKKIETQIVDLTAASAPFGSKDFIRIYENPKRYESDVLALLKDKDANETQKIIAAYSMQKLPLNEYVKFRDELLRLTQKNVVARGVFDAGAFPSEVKSRQLETGYRNPQVRAFLAKLKRSPGFESDGEYIDRILTGEAARDTADRGGT